MMRRIFSVLVVIPLAVVLIALSVANRASVPLRIDVFDPQNPALTIHAPLFIWLFGAMAIGILAGGIGAWFAQGKHRRAERMYKQEAKKLRFEADSKQAGNGAKDKPLSLAASASRG
ncbi:lipopolysaccharide assembly protein LapA domain-containing protein [Oricola sp.]|uniref:lipopolysaccharide assembly protein LapA domain-containing protein n=1 Tax=Oricola sp. TaxID=1979950 RepID=UPI003BAD4FBE